MRPTTFSVYFPSPPPFWLVACQQAKINAQYPYLFKQPPLKERLILKILPFRYYDRTQHILSLEERLSSLIPSCISDYAMVDYLKTGVCTYTSKGNTHVISNQLVKENPQINGMDGSLRLGIFDSTLYYKWDNKTKYVTVSPRMVSRSPFAAQVQQRISSADLHVFYRQSYRGPFLLHQRMEEFLRCFVDAEAFIELPWRVMTMIVNEDAIPYGDAEALFRAHVFYNFFEQPISSLPSNDNNPK